MLEDVKARFPEYAKDIKLNFSSILSGSGTPGLDQPLVYAIAYACAYASRHDSLAADIEAEAGDALNADLKRAALAAVAVMSMNNIYYRFLHLTSDASFKSMPAKLRMNVIANPGIEKKDFELLSLAISAINGCGMCIDAHVQELRKAGASAEAIQSAVRIAAVVHAAAVTLELAGNRESTHQAA